MSRYAAVFLLFVFAAAIGDIAKANEAPPPPPKPSPIRRMTVEAVDCYSCVSCPKITHETAIKTCPYDPDILKVKNCVKYAEKFPIPLNGKNVSWVIRGCASEKGSCAEIKAAYHVNPDLDLEYCVECDGDKCNGVSRPLSDTFFAFSPVVLVPILGKYILS